MDDSCLTTANMGDMQTLLNVFQKFVQWSRFKLKSSKSRALVLSKGSALQWEEEEGGLCLKLDGEDIPNVSEKPIKFLGWWIRADGKDKVVIEETEVDLYTEAA